MTPTTPPAAEISFTLEHIAGFGLYQGMHDYTRISLPVTATLGRGSWCCVMVDQRHVPLPFVLVEWLLSKQRANHISGPVAGVLEPMVADRASGVLENGILSGTCE